MSYSFDFDLTKISRSFFQEIAEVTDDTKIHRRIGQVSKFMVKKFKVHEMTGLPASDAIELMEDMTEIYIKNLKKRQDFEETDKRALLLPHCARKYMDNSCEAKFNAELSTYICAKCSEDCPVKKATEVGEAEGYDVYVFPGSSCIGKLLRKYNYGGLVGVACSEEIKLGFDKLEAAGIDYQGVPLLKNGCANTQFNIETLEKTL